MPVKILIVEDCQVICNLLHKFFKPLAEVVLAHNVTEFKELKTTSDFAKNLKTVIIDYVLPDGNGFIIYRELRAEYPTLPITLWSGHFLSDMEKAIVDADFYTTFVMKPINLAVLRDIAFLL